MSIYLDNAATTQMDSEVIDAMTEVMKNIYGNPSSVHGFGRQARAEIEKARRKVASFLKVSPAEIFFTSGGTEADNMAILCSIRDLGVKRIVTSKLEHHAVLHSVEAAEAKDHVEVAYVKLSEKGHIDLNHLEELLQSGEKTLVSLMHANNEIGNLIDLKKVSELCRKHGAYFHSDTVQTMCHYAFDLSELDIDFITASAHKFHGPKGIGFLYINSNVRIKPMIHGGAQERNMRGGTENIYGIVGLAKAMEVSFENLEEHKRYVQSLKTYMLERLKDAIPAIEFNGDAEGNSLYTVLNVSFPDTPISEMLLFNLDILGISASGGSACSSGSNVGSHVLAALEIDHKRPAIRFSFSKFNTKEEIDITVEKLAELFSKQSVGS
ncbi:MAG: aminotransferase class V-fold PLP-dependent enzyme [Flavobacteriales bacterium]|nr:aminotransferase class V-fold PLP-dependent enzyme [Flavobacteriales bacterium]